jgi:hypothetical protein
MLGRRTPLVIEFLGELAVQVFLKGSGHALVVFWEGDLAALDSIFEGGGAYRVQAIYLSNMKVVVSVWNIFLTFLTDLGSAASCF